jgi:hypothetical protein
MENVTDQELDASVKGLKKIQGFDFSIDTFVIIKWLGGRRPVSLREFGESGQIQVVAEQK